MEKDYKEKIRKLLALAESPNEHEARAALLKARQLMAEHKLSEAELKDVEKKQVKNILTDISCSKRRNPWIINLSAIIGENYCCKGYRSHKKGKQTNSIGFIGFEDDVEICIAIFKYAVDCALSEIKRIKEENSGYCSQYVTTLCDSYGYGFANGVNQAFKSQQDEKNWGLVMVIPEEVNMASQYLEKKVFRSRSQNCLQSDAYHQGYENGTEFDPTKRLDA